MWWLPLLLVAAYVAAAGMGCAALWLALSNASGPGLVNLGMNIYGFAGFLAHCIVGVGYGYAFSKAPAGRLNLLVLMLLPMALVCGALQSAVLFMLDDRIFYVTKWLAYVLTSKFGFQWLIVVPVSAYFAAKRFARRIA